MNHVNNISRIKVIFNALRDMREEVVFVGGAVVSLYAERQWHEVRETDYVDILVEVYSFSDYAAVEERIRKLGFSNVSDSKFVGRYRLGSTIIDVMGLDEKILGFSNRWYAEGFENSILHKIDDETTVRIFSPPYFLATKLEAFHNRGKNKDGEYDGRQSDDFHDIVFMLVYRSKIWEEIRSLPEGELRKYLFSKFEDLLGNPYLEEWIDAHASYSSPISLFIVMPNMKRLLGK
jgi:predicted nucleotidyltransferase